MALAYLATVGSDSIQQFIHQILLAMMQRSYSTNLSKNYLTFRKINYIFRRSNSPSTSLAFFSPKHLKG